MPSIFNPASSPASMKTARFVPEIGDYQLKITGTKLQVRERDGIPKVSIDFYLRIEGSGPATGKLITYTPFPIGDLDPATGSFTVDSEGAPLCDLSKIAEVFHAAYGYGKTEDDDERFAADHPLDGFSLDPEAKTLDGEEWKNVNGHSFISTITHRVANGVKYPNFTAIRPVT